MTRDARLDKQLTKCTQLLERFTRDAKSGKTAFSSWHKLNLGQRQGMALALLVAHGWSQKIGDTAVLAVVTKLVCCGYCGGDFLWDDDESRRSCSGFLCDACAREEIWYEKHDPGE